MKRNLFILILSLFIIDTVNCQKNYWRPWEGLKNDGYINELCYFAKENKLKKLTITVPGYVFELSYISSVLIELSFDSLDYRLKSYKVFFESNIFHENECFDWYTSDVVPKDMSFTLRNNDKWQENLNDQGEDIYGIKHRFYKNKSGENIHHHFVTSTQGDTVFSQWNLTVSKPYYLKYLIFEHSFHENTQHIIYTDYEGEDKNGVYLKEWSFIYDTISYTSIKKLEDQTFEVHQWDRKYKASSAGGIYLDYTENGKDKMNQENQKFSLLDTISLSSYLINPDSYPLYFKVKSNFSENDLKSRFENVVIYRSFYLKKGSYNNLSFPYSLDVLKPSSHNYYTGGFEELKFISTDKKIISISKKFNTCIVEQKIKNEYRIESYYLPKDSTLREKGDIVMQLTYDRKGRLVELFSKKKDGHFFKKRGKWHYTKFEYEDDMFIRRTTAIQKSKRNLSHRKNPNRLRFKVVEVLDYTEQKYLVVNPDDKNDIEIKVVWSEHHEDVEICGDVTSKVEYY